MSHHTASDKPTLSRETVVDAALTIADRQGVGRVTIRNLAQNLEVSPMAIYWHVANKEELFDAMGDRMCNDFVAGPDPNQPWYEQLRAVYTDMVAVLTRYGDAAQIAVPRILYTESGRRLSECLLSLFKLGGFDIAESTQLARHCLCVVVGLVTEPLFTNNTFDAVKRQKALEGYDHMLQTLPRDRYPNLVEASTSISRVEHLEQFNYMGIDLLIEGVKAIAATLNDPAATQ